MAPLCDRQEKGYCIAKDTSIGPVYRRAWEIVNEMEGYEAFVDELKRQQYRPTQASID